MKLFLRRFAAILMAITLTMGSALASETQYVVTVHRLNVRDRATTESDAVTSLREGETVTVESSSKGWGKVNVKGHTGYVAMEYLAKVSSSSSSSNSGSKSDSSVSGTAYTSGRAWLYPQPDDSSEALMRLGEGTKLTLQGETKYFYKVKAEGTTGYVLKRKVSASSSASASSSSSSSGEKSGSSSSSSRSLLKKGDSGDAVRALQERLNKLNYLSSDYVTGKYDTRTVKAVKHFQLQAGLEMDGVAGPATQDKLHSSDAPRMKEVISVDWYDDNGSSLVSKRGGTATIIDCATGTRIKIRRVGGSNHMDVEPATAEDTAKLLSLYGGKWSWHRRAVLLVVGGKYVAASINGMPHGSEISTTNNFEGQFCLHTTNSRTHGTDKVDSGHQSCVEKAMDMFY